MSSLFGALDERIMLAAQPVVSITGGEVLLGEQTTVTLTFDNIPDGSPGGNVGFAPYIDLILPQNGADGAGVGNSPVNDGITFLGAQTLGISITSTVIEFDDAGQAIHPFARDGSGNLRVVNASDYGAAAGDSLVVLTLPFGSFVPDQTPLAISVNLQLSELADLGTPLKLSAVGGFAFGRDALNNPTTDAPVLGAVATNDIVPTLLKVSKIVDAPEAETATGPNFPRNWIGTLDIPAGQTLTNVTFTDRLPDGIVVNGPILLSGATGTAVYDPGTHSVTATIPTVTGKAGTDVTLTIPFYVTEFMQPGSATTPVLDPSLGGPRLLENHLAATATWTPADTRDGAVTVTVDPAGPEAVLTAKSIAIQKTQTVVTPNGGGGGLGPGAVLEYRLNGQVSDYFAQQNLVVTDRMGDGQAFLAGFVPVLTVTEGGLTTTTVINAANYEFVRDPDTGITTIVFRLSDELRTRGGDAALTGGPPDAPATFSIAFRATVETTFLDNGNPVGQGDTIGNSVGVGAAVVGGVGTPGDTSAAAGIIAVGSVEKSLYAVNNAILPAGPGSPIQIASGDLITFRLKYTLPQGIVSTLTLTDFLPLPVFDVDSFTLVLEDTISPAPPPENILRWGPDAAAFDAALTALPVVSKVSAENKLMITFTGLPAGSPPNMTADVLFTVRVIDRPFGDGLMLTNQVTGTETNTNSTVSTTSNALAQVTLTEPTLKLTKGVIATDQPVGVLSPGPVGPVTFTAPGTPGVRFAGEINSTNLAANPVNSNLSNIDGGDRVSFAILVENIGTGKNGAFDIRVTDTLPPGFVIPPGGLNLSVTDGAGNALLFTGDLFSAAGLEITDPSLSAGALKAFAATGGANILVITYDLITSDQVQPRVSIENIATIDNYAAVEGGVDRVPNTQVPTSDNALTRVADPTFEKSVFSTNVTQTGTDRGDPTLEDLTIGEQVTFDLVATLRDGLIRGFEITDTLPPGQIEFVSATMQFAGADLLAGNGAGGTAGALGAPTIIRDGNIVRFVFAEEIVNLANNQTAESDVIRLRLTGVVTDVAANTPGTVLTNNAALQFDLGTREVFIRDDARVEVVGPDLAITKTPDRTVADAGDIVTYTVVATARDFGFTGPAFDVLLRDALPAGLILVAGSATLLSAPAGTPPITENGNEVRLSIPELNPGETIRFSYQARLADSVISGTVLPNTVSLTADSFPGTPPPLPGGVPGPERLFAVDTTAEVRVATVAIAKTVAAADTSLAETTSSRFDPNTVDLAVGEIVTYRIVITLPEATTSRLTVTDFLPGALAGAGRLQFLSGDVTQVGSNLTFLDLAGPAVDVAAVGSATAAGGILDTATFTFGRVENRPDANPNPTDADRIFITVTARVLDAQANTHGVVAVNNAQVDFGTGINRASAAVEIVTPSVGIVKTSSSTSGDGGDRVTFNVRIPTTSATGGPAYDVVVQDVIPVGFEIDPTTLTFTTATRPDWTLSYDSVTRTITARLPVYLVEDVDPNFRYTAVVTNEVRPDQVLTNRASVTYDSHPGDPGDQFQRDYGPVRDSTDFTVDRPELNKTVFTSDLATTPLNEAVIGETITYRIELRLPEVQSTFELRDLLPSLTGLPVSEGSMELISSRIVSIGSNLTFTPSGPAVDDAGAIITGGVAWNLGQVRNTADNIRDGKDVIVFEVVARVPNIVANQPGDDLINLARVDYGLAGGGTASVSDTETITIVAPELVATKTPSAATGDAGDVITYTISVTPDALASSADAYGIVITDALHPLLRLNAGSVTATLGGVVIGTIVTGNTAGDSTIRFTLDRLPDATAAPLLITYRATLVDEVRAGNTIPNTVDIAWQSAPDNGAFPEARDDATSASASVGVVITDSFTKNVIATTLVETTGDDVALGERVTYELVATLGEGTQRLLIQDALPPGMAIVSASVFSIGAGISGSLLNVGDAGLITGNSVRFDFGNNVVNDGTNGAGSEQIVIRVVGRVVADPAVNPDGRILTNAATLTSDISSTPLRASDSVRVVAPNVVIDKSSNVTTGDAGDIVTYTVVVRQQAGATGPLYDLVVTDLLPARMALVEGSVTTDRGTVILGDDAGETSVEVRLTGAALLATDNPATPGVDESRVTVTYRARILDSAEPGETITNRADFTGSTAPDSIVTDPNERRSVSGSDDAVVAVVMPIDLSKTIITTSLPETLPPNVAQGELITYRLVATIAEGTQELVVRDALPAGLLLVSASVTGRDAALPASLLSIANTGTGNSVVFDFGTVVNPGTDGQTARTIEITIEARVQDTTPIAPGTTLTNAGVLEQTPPSNPAAPPVIATDDTTVRVVAPALDVTKTVNDATVQAGQVVTYTVNVAHTSASTGPAYDVVVTDTLVPGLVLTGATASVGTVTITGNTVSVSIPVLLVGQTVAISYTARVADAIEPGQVVPNTANLGWDSAAGPGGLAGTDSAAAEVRGEFALDLVKTIFDTALPDTGPGVAVGETVTYRLTATVTPGTQTLVISDTLPPGMTFESARVVSVAGGLPLAMLAVLPTTPAVGSTGAVTFNFGTIVNPGADTAVDSVTVEIVTRVADVPGNVNGTDLLNAASATVASPTDPGAVGGTLTDTANVSVPVVAPVLVIDKSAPPAFLAPGETVVYTLELRHAGTSTSPAYDVVVNDLLADPYLELVPGTVTALVNGVAAGTIITADGTLRVELPILRLGEVLTITFTGRALATMPVAETLTNTVTASYDSANDGVPGTEGRPGSTTDTQNLPTQPGFDKEIVATSLPETGVSFFDPARVDLAIGEVVTYRLTITLPQGLTEDLVLTDEMPGGLQPLTGRVVSVGAGFPPGLLGVAATIDPVTGRVSFNFGDVTNTSLAAVGAEDRIVVEIDARVRDATGVIAGSTLTNAAQADFTIGGRAGALTDAVTVDVVEPSLTIDKAVIGATTGDAGDVMTYTVTIAHAPSSSGPAYDLVVTDPLPASLVPLSVTSSRGTASIVPGGIQLSLGSAAFLPTEGPITLTYTVRLANTVEPGQVIPNTATLNFDSAAGDGGRAGTAHDAAEVTAVFTADLQKTVTGTSLTETGSGSFNPDRPDAAIGETVFYQLQATISEGTQRLVITDSVPEGMRILSGSLVTQGSGITAAAPVITISADGRNITFDFGTVVNAGSTGPLDASDRITLAVSTLVVDGPLQVAGRELTNNAQVVISSPTEPGRPGGTVIDDASATVDLVTSVLALDKSASPPFVDAGDEVTYTLTLRHPGGSTGPAYNVLVSDVLSSAVTFIPGSLRVVSGPGIATFVGTDRIEVQADVLLLTDVVTIEYRARVTDAIEAGQVIPNTANVAFATAPNVEGRPGNDDASASVLGQFSVALDKQIIATSLPQTGNGFFDPAAPDLAIGETATYRLTATLSEGTQRLVLTDSLPAGMVIESASVAGLGAGISAFSLSSLTFSGTSFRLEALVVNTGNNILGDGTVLVDVVARVADVAANVAGRSLVNSAEATVSSPTNPSAPGGTLVATDTAAADVVVPVLTFDKAVGQPFAGLGEPVTYTLTLTHAGNSTAPAFNVVLQDLLADQNLELVPGSVVTSLGVVVLGNGGADGVVRVELGELALGQTLTVTFQVIATGVPAPDGIAPNTAGFAVASSPDAPAGFQRSFQGSDTALLQVSSGLDFAIGARAGGSLFANDIDPEDAPLRVPQAPAIFTGTATPGAVVQLAIRDQNGTPLAATSGSADASGAWLIRGPDPIGPQGDLPTAENLAPSRGGLSLARADSVPQTAGMNNAPFSVVAQGTNPMIGPDAPAADGIRLSFAGTGGSANGVFTGGSDQVSTAVAGATGASVARDLAGLTAPQSLAWNRFALDFVAATASPSAAR